MIIQADESTATIVCVQMRKKQDAYLNKVAKQVKPSDRTFKQMLAYLVEKYHAVPTVLSQEHSNEVKARVIIDYFPEVLQEDMEFEITPEEQFRYRTRSEAFIRALYYPAEKLGLEFRTFVLPHKLKVKKVKNSNTAPQLTHINERSILEVEMRTEYMSGWNIEDSLMDDLCLWRGVTQKDIDEKTPRFINYVEVRKRLKRIE